jgi:GMP synthase-like glutamine amidotransferase
MPGQLLRMTLLVVALLLIVQAPGGSGHSIEARLHRITRHTLPRDIADAHPDRHTKHFGILQTDEFNDHLRSLFPAGYARIFVDWLGDPAARERWFIFRAFEAHLPSPDEISRFSAFVVTGSKADAHGDEPWVVALRKTIVAISQQSVRLLGVCFGAQVISVALGGVSGRAGAGWELGFKPIAFTGKGVLKSVQGLAPLTYEMEYHRDRISRLPPGALLLASSPNCSVEMYQIPATAPRVLAVQFHPEFDEAYNRASLAYKKTAALVPSDVADAALETLARYGEAAAAPDSVQANPEPIRQLLRQFFRGEGDFSATTKCC